MSFILYSNFYYPTSKTMVISEWSIENVSSAWRFGVNGVHEKNQLNTADGII